MAEKYSATRDGVMGLLENARIISMAKEVMVPLVGKSPDEAGAVLSLLLAIWLAGNAKEDRAELLKLVRDNAETLVPSVVDMLRSTAARVAPTKRPPPGREN